LTECLKGSLLDKENQTVIMKTKDEEVKKYIRNYLPDLCYKAKKVRGLYDEPMTLFIFSFIIEIEKLNEKGNFVIEDWTVFLKLMKQFLVDNQSEGIEKDKVSNIYNHLNKMLDAVLNGNLFNDNSQNKEEIDIKLVMTVIMKETTLKLFKNVAPSLYQQRFNDQLVLEIIQAYCKGNATNIVN